MVAQEFLFLISLKTLKTLIASESIALEMFLIEIVSIFIIRKF